MRVVSPLRPSGRLRRRGSDAAERSSSHPCDELCLYIPLPESHPDFLLSTMEVAFKENIRTVSGQFISVNAENGQYCLNPYYFEALKRVLERSDSVYVPG